jgi:SAM-dependent methyltransferase
MEPEPILRDWHRVLRPGGRCLIEWFPLDGPWGPHMDALIPIPWAHVLFGQNAMFRTAESIYDLPEFVPRHRDLDEHGNKKTNKWKNWSSFEEQGFINDRPDLRSFGGSPFRNFVSSMLKNLPVIGIYFVSSAIVELRRPE